MEFEIFKSKIALKICTGKKQKIFMGMSESLSFKNSRILN